MPTFTTEVYDEALGHSFESTIEATSVEKGTVVLNVRVPAGSPYLVLTVSDVDPYFTDRGPSNVNVFVSPPENAEVQPAKIVTEGGTVIFFVKDPPEGTWQILAEYQPNASARLSVSAFGKRFWERLRTLPRAAACKSCKLFLKASVEVAIAAIVLHALPVGAVAATVGGTLQAWFGFRTLEITWEQILKILLGYADTPLDTMVHKICKLARVCVGEA